jgi:hypothetical protein
MRRNASYYGATDRTFVAIDDGHNILFLQVRTGRLAGGNANVASVWEQFEENPGVDLDGAIAAAAEQIGMHPSVLRAQVRGTAAHLISDGILTTRRPGPPPRRLRAILADESAQPARREPADPDQRVPARVAIAGAVALAIALVLKRLPFWVQLEILAAIRRVRPQRATLSDTRRLAAAVKRAARRCPGRVECLEQSMGAFIAGALLAAAPDWCHGGSLLQDTYHAWVQADDTAVDYTDQYGVELTTMICV